MSGRFVSGGTIGAGDTETVDDGSAAPAPARAASKLAEWEKVQQQLEADRQRRHDARVKAASGEERSLYDVLQANKAAKEAAAAEASKLTNQFRALDDDEVEFLDEVAARQRQAEESVRRETEEGLKAFRAATRKKVEKEGVGIDGEGQGEEEEWGTRKRKRRTERDAGLGVAKRKVSVGEEGKKTKDEKKNEDGNEGKKQAEPVKKTEKNEDEEKPKKTALALVDYGSDSDE
ncbi:hypothetical protein LMH87_011516 [Akanthomyces muscarius]|uniref:FAM192A/Fyv6 N-terminal domain-containing protein n=1 Tax=Akanthomyces muscarius TaxID=2231603 RepID=A0A9W8QBF7_AKAMU|nr:hypothetical protein LMH87_011516 [Akanthomyces muscarius]KAJ4150782.1 hypothetical protein LMH87_011516 [Akanthomyces muscarius]